MIRADVKSFSWGYVVDVHVVRDGAVRQWLAQCRYSKNDINGPVQAMRDCLGGLPVFMDHDSEPEKEP